MRCLPSMSMALLVVMGQSSAIQAADPTAAEKYHRQLREFDDRLIERLADRWWALIERQTWSDATGKFSVEAKYVSHDEELTSVTLLAAKGKGKQRVEKEITVPLEKLSKDSQARVRRIARLKPIIEEKLAEVQSEQAEQDEQDEQDPPQPRGGDDDLYRNERPPQNPHSPRREAAADDRAHANEDANEELTQTAENPYGGTKFLTRDKLVDDRRFASDQPTEPREVPTPSVGEPSPQAAATAADVANHADYVVPIPLDRDDFPERTNDDEWIEFHEPFGDESHLQFRTVPAAPVAGEPVKLLVITGSLYGRVKPKAFARLGDTSMDEHAVMRDPDAGPSWVPMEMVGGRIEDLKTGEMKWLGETAENPRAEQMGETYYQLGLKLPAGKSAVDLRFEYKLLGDRTIAVRALDWDAPAASAALPTEAPVR